METLKTRWAEQAKCDCPLNDYPRPQMVREKWVCLNGMYDYAVTDENCTAFPAKANGLIRVPFALESSLSGVCRHLKPNERLWYRRKFNAEKTAGRLLLHFEAVDWECNIFINGKEAGFHRGGYLPFAIDITDLVTDGENELVVKVYDPTEAHWQSRGKQVSKSTGFWYTATSGIWQTVWMETVPENYINKYKLTPDIDKGVFRIETDIVGEGSLHISVFDEGNVIVDADIGTDCEIAIPDAKLWSPETPFLYDFTLELRTSDTTDKVLGYVGMRKFGIANDESGLPRLTLNNKPYFQKGLLDQGYWSDGGLTAPTDEAMIYDIETMKRLGFNMLRKHIKVEPARWYYHCDKIGMIVWQDMVSGGKALNPIHAGVIPNISGVLSPVYNLTLSDGKKRYGIFGRTQEENRNEYYRELLEMIDTLYSFTSIGCWVPFNEGWGQFDAKVAYDKIREVDATRVIDHASGWYDQKGGDLKSVHKYILPVVTPKKDGRPFVLSEYGGYSQILDGHVWNKARSFGYMMYMSKDKLSKAYKKLHEKQVIPQIKKGLCATVYTQVSDVEFEVNGMLTYDREIVKIDEQTIIDINKQLTY